MVDTPLGTIQYPAENDTSWYTRAEDGVELWLERAELLGLPQFDTFADLPDASTAPAGYDDGAGIDVNQRAYVNDENAVYRTDGTNWVLVGGQPSFATLSDVPANVATGVEVWVEDEGRYYVEDGT